ncbi:uncharacterized protein CLUP02_10179 [Colletotrichum lupini]|uniref:Uncharacterized protein n=1 Tax=Colletotrichum lupini TaxID=145971 RepID=A0A9Q8WIA5_9PEZI|nr:uncharacterized protein CLUP02_10179 [Colletotrichum lupini]UQC84683.1 hypothetical protein CLUP02_10179 [Colletotrichum lupini]
MEDTDRSHAPLSIDPITEAEETHLLGSERRDGKSSSSPPDNFLSSSTPRKNGYEPMTPSVDMDHSTLNGAAHNQSTAPSQPDKSSFYGRDPFGISVEGSINQVSFARVPVGSKTSSPATPRSNKGLLGSPKPEPASPRTTERRAAPLSPESEQDTISPLQSPWSSPDGKRRASSKRKISMAWDDPPKSSKPWPLIEAEEMGDLGQATPGKDESQQQARPPQSTSGQSSTRRDENSLEEPDPMDDEEALYKRFSKPCPVYLTYVEKQHNWLSISILILSFYSTGLSCLWLVVAIVQPRWGPQISSSGGILPSTASLVCAMFAKTIEISFVTVFVTFIGQVLTRRAFVRRSEGMTLAEMTMRNWVIQPGFLITHWETLPYAGMTILGVVSLVATIASTFYTTASDAMITPKLKFGDWETKTLSGYVLASYMNPPFARETCPTPLRDSDPLGVDVAGNACLEVQYAGQSYRNLVSFLGDWESINRNGTSDTVDVQHRPVGSALLYDNTTLTSAWIETTYSNTTEQYERFNRIINNVTLAIPHPSVYDAATNPVNKILQPNDLSGVGEYGIRASVVSPALNVMCVNMSPEELEPLVYTEWPIGKVLYDDTTVPGQRTGKLDWEKYVPVASETEWLNRTSVDEIFRWGQDYGRRPPVFPLYPADYNMITNTSVESDAIYILTKSASITDYTLCEMRSWVSPNCSTHFNISGTAGAHMQAHCDDPDDTDSYTNVHTEVTESTPNIADQWRLSMDINGGAQNNNASNARILTQFVLQEPQLNPLLPSIAEALAVYASSTLIIGGLNTPFEHYWRHEKMQLGAPGSLDPFNASIRTQEYTSGHSAEWQKCFYLVLALVFVINVICLAYLLSRSGLVTDFTEPQNLFALAVNSPPSEQLKGSCGGGPVKRDLVVPWRVGYTSGANHYFFEEANDRPWRGKYSKQDLSADTGYNGQERTSVRQHHLSSVEVYCTPYRNGLCNSVVTTCYFHANLGGINRTRPSGRTRWCPAIDGVREKEAVQNVLPNLNTAWGLSTNLPLASLPFPIHNYFVAAKYGYLTLQLAVDPSCNSYITYLIRSFCYLRIFVLTSHTQRRLGCISCTAHCINYPLFPSVGPWSWHPHSDIGIPSHSIFPTLRGSLPIPDLYTVGISPAPKQQRRSKSLKNEGDQKGAKLKRTATKAIPLATFLSPPNLSPFIEECQPFNFGIINICVPALAIEAQPTGANKSVQHRHDQPRSSSGIPEPERVGQTPPAIKLDLLRQNQGPDPGNPARRQPVSPSGLRRPVAAAAPDTSRPSYNLSCMLQRRPPSRSLPDLSADVRNALSAPKHDDVNYRHSFWTRCRCCRRSRSAIDLLRRVVLVPLADLFWFLEEAAESVPPVIPALISCIFLLVALPMLIARFQESFQRWLGFEGWSERMKPRTYPDFVFLHFST